MTNWIFTAIYLAIGAGIHALLLGPTFMVGNLLSWFIVFAWPIALFVIGLFIFFAGLLLLILIVWLIDLWNKIPFIANYRTRRFIKKHRLAR